MEDKKVKYAVITGAASGIGLNCAISLANKGVHIIGIAKDEKSCEEARVKILRECPEAGVLYIACDLSSLSQIKTLGGELTKRFKSIDMLIHAHLCIASHFMTTEDGIEVQFAKNYLSLFLLTHELFASLKAAPRSKIIILSPGIRCKSKPDAVDFQMKKRYSATRQFKRTNYCNMLFAAEFNRLVYGSIRAYIIGGGVLKEDIEFIGTPYIKRAVKYLNMNKNNEQVKDIIKIALENDLPEDEFYWQNGRPVKIGERLLNKNIAEKLWKVSEKHSMTGNLEI